MADEAVIQLAHGLWYEDACDRTAAVRPLTGADEVLLAELAPLTTHAARVTALLAAATVRIGRRAPVSADDVRALTVGDRERLLLALYHLSFERIEAVARCSAPACGAELELDVTAGELLTAPNDEVPCATYEITVGKAPGDHRVRFRLPNGGDQEQAAVMATADPRGAADSIIRRCVIGVCGHDGESKQLEEALPALREPLAEAFARLDPQAATTIRLQCPACGAESTALLDAGFFLLARLTNTRGIFAEVHRIAQVYHWHEAEILALPVTRRRRYLTLIAQGGGLS